MIAGVGFLGGGAILKPRESDMVTGLTTAATIWIVAALGIACGGGHWLPAVAAVIIVESLLIFGGSIASFAASTDRRLRRPRQSDATSRALGPKG